MFSDVDFLSLKYRKELINLDTKCVLIANLTNSEQENDLTLPPNCRGLGRVHHFRRKTSNEWPDDPLPMDPACKALGLPKVDLLKAQVFQCAACNYRCWYCFVPRELLKADSKRSKWCSAGELADMYLDLENPPRVIDLSGGQPELIPEWVPWMMEALQERGLASKVYLWSDDNLSTDFFWRFLSEPDHNLIEKYPSYGKVACFKGFNQQSFSFNTGVEPSFFERQFELMGRLLKLKIDLYVYVTFTTSSIENVKSDMVSFVNRLQDLDENLPLRTVPLEIKCFTPTKGCMNKERVKAMRNQYVVVNYWREELEKQYPKDIRDLDISAVPLPS